ncbi:heterokaryon incompatibility protein-domain-containing protein [Xylariales sp. PMI_506]|nr:heterokaryon incompatibility protein-domain-containing protein [Xylariales sp. PMI_506]
MAEHMIYRTIAASSEGPIFRLLTVHPAESAEDDIRCSLAETPLGNPPPYEALSYFWGDASNPQPVCCNSHILHVTWNLFTALRHLRHTQEDRVLWVDAICINQTDLAERAAQVILMRDIYQSANDVVVWLGEQAQGSELVLPMCERLSAHRGGLLCDEDLKAHKMEYLWGPGTARIRKKLRGLQMSGDESEITQDVGPDRDPSSVEIDALLSFLKRPWFSRCWVLQELCVGRSTTMVCGTTTTTWDVLLAGVVLAALFSPRILRGRPEEILNRGIFRMSALWGPFHARIHDLDNANGEFANLPMMDLLSLLWATLAFDATDSRDKVYALLGLVDEEHRPLGIVPDYTISTSECFRRTACAILKQTKTLDLLLSDHRAAKTDDTITNNLPSWVPDWSSKAPDSPSTILYLEKRDESSFSACGSAAASYTPVFLDNDHTLLVKGFVIDQIKVLEDVITMELPQSGLDKEYLMRPEVGFRETTSAVVSYLGNIYTGMGDFFDTFVSWEKLALDKTGVPYPTAEDPLHVFVATVCLGDMPDGPDARVAQYRDWSRRLAGPRGVSRLRQLGGSSPTGKSSALYRAAMGISASTGLIAGAFMRQASPSSSGFHGQDTDWGIDRTFNTAMERSLNRRLARTTGGYLGIVPAASQVGDALGLFRGGKVPFVIRKAQGAEDARWELIGPAYVHGVMHGELWDSSQCVEMHLV